MPRRNKYTELHKKNQVRADHVKRKGDVVYRGFQCLNGECTHFNFVLDEDIDEEFEIECPECGYILRAGDETTLFEYELRDTRDGSAEVIEEGQFSILHDDYVGEAQRYKYCLLCNSMKPLHLFAKHGGRKSGRQGECKICKDVYNGIKNQTRLTDQHREAAQTRRLFIDITGRSKINSPDVFRKFKHRCFKCGKDLKSQKMQKERHLDHTLPVSYLWPATTDSATLLCSRCNNEKHGKWPSEFYSMEELKELSILTGIDLELLAGQPEFNPEYMEKLKKPDFVDELLVKSSGRMREIMRLRNRILESTGFDMFGVSRKISREWIEKADKEYGESKG